MGFSDKKGITVASGFKLQAQAPLDARTVVDTIADRDELVTIKAAYAGLPVYVTATKKMYTYDGSAWVEQTTGSAYVHPTTPGNKHIPVGGASGQILKWKADGEAEWAAEKNYDDELAEKVPVSRKVNNRALSADITLTAADVGAISATLKGASGGVAELDASGKVPAAQLPSYVDDVLDVYVQGGKAYSDSEHTQEITYETGKIYIDLTTNKTYRWSGTALAEISASIALGETAATAYRGDRGKIAYDHSQTAHAPANAQANVQSDWSVTDDTSDAFIKNKPTSMPANGGNASTVGGHTVATDVPAGAVFTDTKPVGMTGATAEAAGEAGYVPVPTAGAQAKYLRGDGTWQTPPNTTYSPATQSANGLMSAEDKKKLDTMPQIYFASELPSVAPVGSICFLIS
ncbi:MAG: hypothetical protein Q4D90_02480 [bacterium]|nr:hypothetical protein [bacterium]